MQLVVQRQEPQMVRNILLLIVHLVIWSPVCAIAIGVVSSSILKTVPRYERLQRVCVAAVQRCAIRRVAVVDILRILVIMSDCLTKSVSGWGHLRRVSQVRHMGDCLQRRR